MEKKDASKRRGSKLTVPAAGLGVLGVGVVPVDVVQHAAVAISARQWLLA